MATPAMGGAPRQGILSLAIKDKGALFNAYMSRLNYDPGDRLRVRVSVEPAE